MKLTTKPPCIVRALAALRLVLLPAARFPRARSFKSALPGVAVLIGTLSLSACQEVKMPGVYRIDIQQGNVITQAQLAMLEAGMEKRKVRFILGTPLVTDAFNQDRWDYYYSLEKRGEERVQRIISVFFDADRLSHVGGDVRAASGPIEIPERVDKVVSVPEGYRSEGILASLVPSFLSGKPNLKPAQDEAPVADSPAADADAAAAATTVGAAPSDPAALTQPAAPPSSQTEPQAARQAMAPATTAITVDAEDERYLRDLLGGLGRDESAPAGSSRDSAAAKAEALRAASEQEKEEEGLLSRWAKRLGWGNDPEPAAAKTTGTPSTATALE